MRSRKPRLRLYVDMRDYMMDAWAKIVDQGLSQSTELKHLRSCLYFVTILNIK
jgi:hypothetical protein